jgi:hypothetical protein
MDDLAGAFSFHRATSAWSTLDEKSNNPNHISIVTTSDDLRKVGALRYSMYVERDRKPYPYADTVNRRFLEPIDLRSLNLMALVDGNCVAAIRLTRAADNLADEYLSRLLSQISFDSSELKDIVVCSRLVVASGTQARLHTAALLQEAYRLSLLNGATMGVMSTRPSLIPFFTRMGFVAYGSTYIEKAAGELAVLHLKLWDRKALAAASSIFLDVYDAVTSSNKFEVTA